MARGWKPIMVWAETYELLEKLRKKTKKSVAAIVHEQLGGKNEIYGSATRGKPKKKDSCD